MPFKSKSQRRACHAANDPNWNCAEWEEETPKGKLPEKLPKKAMASLGNRVKVAMMKQAVQMAAQQLIPGAPPVNRIVPPAPAAQAPAAAPAAPAQPAAPAAPQPAAAGVPQAPVAQVPTMPTAKDVLRQGQQKAPGAPLDALTHSEGVIADKLSKMSSAVHRMVAITLGRYR